MRRLLIIVATLSLTSCINLPKAVDLPPRYTLAAAPAAERSEKLPVTLSISDARAEGALNTSRIAVKTAPNEIRYLSDGEWSDRLPRVFSLLLERSVEEREQLLAVSDRVAMPVADYSLYADIMALHLDRSEGAPTARVAFRLRLQTGKGRVLGARAFTANVPAPSNTTREAASSIAEAAATATSEAADWALDLIDEDQSSSS